ncbi:MAG: DUF6134 family protein [Parvibaculales bacterium]
MAPNVSSALEKIISAQSHPFVGKQVALPPGNVLAFKIDRKGKDIGYQHMMFAERADGSLEVNIHIDIKVVVGFITFYDFLHENTEVWKDGNLLSLNSRTRLDGKNTQLSIRRVEDMLVVNNGESEDVVVGSLKPSSYWYADFTLQDQVIDTATGKLLDLAPEYLGSSQGDEADRHSFTLTKDIPADVVYSDAGHWVGFTFGKARDVTYTPVSADALPPREKWRHFD